MKRKTIKIKKTMYALCNSRHRPVRLCTSRSIAFDWYCVAKFKRIRLYDSDNAMAKQHMIKSKWTIERVRVHLDFI